MIVVCKKDFRQWGPGLYFDNWVKKEKRDVSGHFESLWLLMVYNTIRNHLYIRCVLDTLCQQKKKNEKMKQQ
jgi:hypothetical protein